MEATQKLEQKIEELNVLNDLKTQRLQVKINDTNSKYNNLKRLYMELEDKHDTLLGVSDYQKQISFPLKGNGEKIVSNSIIISQFSDWHVEQVVSESSVDYQNKYNPDVAKARVTRVTKNKIKLINDLANQNKFVGHIIHLGGDFINGWIHEENIETNAMSPIEATIFATELLSKSLKTIFEQEKVKKFWLICSVGNHGRLTKRYRYGNIKQTSLETMIYSNLIKEFVSYKNVEFIFPDSGIGYFDLGNGQYIRYKHGHEVKYLGGVGGLNVPLNQKQMGWDKTKKAIFNIMGHYHTCSMPNENTMMNGCLVGFDGFAQYHGFKRQDACQSLILYNNKYGFTGFYRISAEV